jgi:bacterial/archaeal transporter family-2 protein
MDFPQEIPMPSVLLLVLIGVLGGLAVGLQGPIAGAMSQRVGGAVSSLVIHVSGALFSVLLVMARGGERLGNWRQLPWYMWGAGFFGVVLYLTLSLTFPRLGSTMALTCIIVGQLTAGLVLDHFGFLGVTRPIDLGRLLGMGAVLSGAYLIYR